MSDQPALFEDSELIPWLVEWQNMPEFCHQDLAPRFQVIVNFACAADARDFGLAIGQDIEARTGKQMQSIWYPEQEIGRMVNKRYIDGARQQ